MQWPFGACVLLTLAFGLSGSLALTGTADAAVSCTFTPTTRVLEISVSGEAGVAGDTSVGFLKRFGAELRVSRFDEDLGRKTRVVCTGGIPTVGNTDTVAARLVDGSLLVSQNRGTLAPGATAESDGTSEIEFRLRSEGASVVAVTGTNDRDTIRAGRIGAGVLGINLNAGLEAAPDIDLTLEPLGLSFLGVYALMGRDVVTSSGGREFDGPFGPKFVAVGGPGNDTLRADRSAALFGKQGNDRLFGGAGPDVLVDRTGHNLLVGGRGKDDIDTSHGGIGRVMAGPGNDTIDAEDAFFGRRRSRDRVRCGGGNDYVDADDVDRIAGCERRD